ncbi:MAG TPA: RtcB family protein [Candidatus Acidoferrales bacterium]|nr:RtcB family protein [Candidatus Acidoferrales bacterium]
MKVIKTGKAPIKAWIDGVEFEDDALRQLQNIAELRFVFSHIDVMRDVHAGTGATVGAVIPTIGAIIPAAVGVDIGCGMIAQRTSLRQEELPDDLRPIRDALERTIPGGFGKHKHVPASVSAAWKALAPAFDRIVAKHPVIDNGKPIEQLATLGGGNHFVELAIG